MLTHEDKELLAKRGFQNSRLLNSWLVLKKAFLI